jgi:phosphatidate cytidylyltransferase
MAADQGFLKTFGVRLLAAMVMLPLFIFTAFWGGWWFFAFTAVAVFLVSREFAQLALARGVKGVFPELILFQMIILLAFQMGGPGAGGELTGFLILMLLVWAALRGRIEGAWERVGTRVLALFYLAWLPAHWILLRGLGENMGFPAEAAGKWMLFGAGIIWLGDTGAYLVGSLFGRHSLGTPVSPNKSVEGVLGGLATSLAVAWFLREPWMPFLSGFQALGLGLVVALGGQIGDLFESLLKRGAGSKDSGQAIPGHGGFLDRLDSLLFGLPLLYYFLVWVIF